MIHGLKAGFSETKDSFTPQVLIPLVSEAVGEAFLCLARNGGIATFWRINYVIMELDEWRDLQILEELEDWSAESSGDEGTSQVKSVRRFFSLGIFHG